MTRMEYQDRSTVINVKVQNLRKIGYASLEDWVKDPKNIYIGRYCKYVKGAIASKWKNPYSLKEYSLEDSLRLYEKWILKSGLIKDIQELKGKTLGCWCKPNSCHGDILIKLLN